MDELRNIYYDDDPLVLVNGMPLKNFHFLLNYSSEDIERIDIVRRLFAVGSLIFPGVLSIELKEGLSTEQLTDNKIYRVRNEIITQVTTPQYPDYENHVQRKSRYPDLRNTLFWLPDLKMESPEQEISFYTSDISGKYRIHIEGLVNDTIPVSAFGEFHVETNY
jgi:hypothetical protein